MTWTVDDLRLDPDRCVVSLPDGSTATLAQALEADQIPNPDDRPPADETRRTNTT